MVALVRFALGFMLVLTALFLILLVLIQRGRGGGLTGALGGAGGQSAFGTKAGDVFTRITVGVAGFWIALCILSLNVLGRRESPFSGGLGGNAPQAVAPQTQPGGAASGTPSGTGELSLPDANASGTKDATDEAGKTGTPEADSATPNPATPQADQPAAATETGPTGSPTESK